MKYTKKINITKWKYVWLAMTHHWILLYLPEYTLKLIVFYNFSLLCNLVPHHCSLLLFDNFLPFLCKKIDDFEWISINFPKLNRFYFNVSCIDKHFLSVSLFIHVSYFFHSKLLNKSIISNTKNRKTTQITKNVKTNKVSFSI